MTNEEAIEIFSKVKELPCGWCYEGGDEFKQAINLAIKALEESKQGEWISCKSTRTGQITNIDYKCSECSHHKDRPVPYCEICGAKMKKGGAEE